MSDADKSLNIQITTTAELAGAKALENQLEQSLGKAKALGNSDDVKKFSEQLTTVRGSLANAAESS